MSSPDQMRDQEPSRPERPFYLIGDSAPHHSGR
ncbi:hypothetical protein RSAG8_05426, partial [Rhizoctonia solani AG-8 WAC10335]